MDSLRGYESDDGKADLEVKVQLPVGCAKPVYPVSSGSSGGKALIPLRKGNSDASWFESKGMTTSALIVAPSGTNNAEGLAGNATNQKITSYIYAPMQGPVGPTKNISNRFGSVVGQGLVQEIAIDDYVFDHEFQANEGRRSGAKEKKGNIAAIEEPKMKKKKKGREIKDVLGTIDDVGDEYSGPWAHPSKSSEESLQRKTNLAIVNTRKDELEMQKREDEEKRAEKVLSEKHSDGDGGMEEHASAPAQAVVASAKFHGESLRDYQGRGWTHPPPGIKARDLEDSLNSEAYVPKKCARKFTGHTKGVNAVEFLPGTGHLLLSGGLEGKCKIWDVYKDRNVRQTYIGHGAAVKSIAFNNHGEHFLSSGFDKVIQLWDTETGQAVGTFSNNTTGFSVKFNPKDNHEFLVAASDHRVYGWDARSGKVAQEYNYHLKAVNHVSFYDDGRRFFSTSDDKKILCWEYGVPVPTKYIADPDMYSIPTCTMHPSQECFAGQSMDNRVVIYTCKDPEKVKINKKKSFHGHNTAGYACGISFSPNGQYVVSGDGTGLLCVWDWKTSQLFRKFQAHDHGPCMDTSWHPLEPSWLASCGWDGVVKLWE